MSRPRKKHEPLGMDFGEVLKKVGDGKVREKKLKVSKTTKRSIPQRQDKK